MTFYKLSIVSDFTVRSWTCSETEIVRHSDSKHMELLSSHNPWNRRRVVVLSPSLIISEHNLTGLYTVEREVIYYLLPKTVYCEV